jgi:Asp-tRNA(Asn)/Glu-tRNA(Gln) amidotransferase B subunit
MEEFTYKSHPEYGPFACEWFDKDGIRRGSIDMPFCFFDNEFADKLKDMQVDRSAAYRKADPELAYEDSFQGSAKNVVIGLGKKLSKKVKKPLHELVAREVFQTLGDLIEKKIITSVSAEIVLGEMYAGAVSVEEVLQNKKLQMSEDGKNERETIEIVIIQQPPALSDYLEGKMSALGALIGLTMKVKPGLNPLVIRREWEKVKEGTKANFSTDSSI